MGISNGIEKLGGIICEVGEEATKEEEEGLGDWWRGDLCTTWSNWLTRASSLSNCLISSSTKTDLYGFSRLSSITVLGTNCLFTSKNTMLKS